MLEELAYSMGKKLELYPKINFRWRKALKVNVSKYKMLKGNRSKCVYILSRR